jgi:hypothetical protein
MEDINISGEKEQLRETEAYSDPEQEQDPYQDDFSDAEEREILQSSGEYKKVFISSDSEEEEDYSESEEEEEEDEPSFFIATLAAKQKPSTSNTQQNIYQKPKVPPLPVKSNVPQYTKLSPPKPARQFGPIPAQNTTQPVKPSYTTGDRAPPLLSKKLETPVRTNIVVEPSITDYVSDRPQYESPEFSNQIEEGPQRQKWESDGEFSLRQSLYKKYRKLPNTNRQEALILADLVTKKELHGVRYKREIEEMLKNINRATQN